MKYVLAVMIIVCLIGCSAEPEPVHEPTEYEKLAEVADLQAVKIAVIRQGIILEELIAQVQDPNTP
jgi:hypothetical protein